jgi:hypothetical protein
MRPLRGIVRSGQSDIEATSGSETVSPRSRRPYMLTFQSRLPHHTLDRRARDGPRPTLRTNDARLDVARRRIIEPPGRDNHRSDATGITPQRASEVSSGNDSLPPLCCLTRNQCSLQHVRCSAQGQPSSAPKGFGGSKTPSRTPFAGADTDELEQRSRR